MADYPIVCSTSTGRPWQGIAPNNRKPKPKKAKNA